MDTQKQNLNTLISIEGIEFIIKNHLQQSALLINSKEIQGRNNINLMKTVPDNGRGRNIFFTYLMRPPRTFQKKKITDQYVSWI